MRQVVRLLASRGVKELLVLVGVLVAIFMGREKGNNFYYTF